MLLVLPPSLLWTLCAPHWRICSALPLSFPPPQPHTLCPQPLHPAPSQLYHSGNKKQETNNKEEPGIDTKLKRLIWNNLDLSNPAHLFPGWEGQPNAVRYNAGQDGLEGKGKKGIEPKN